MVHFLPEILSSLCLKMSGSVKIHQEKMGTIFKAELVAKSDWHLLGIITKITKRGVVY